MTPFPSFSGARKRPASGAPEAGPMKKRGGLARALDFDQLVGGRPHAVPAHRVKLRQAVAGLHALD